MDLFVRHRARSLAPEALAEVFDRLIWCLDDQGAALLSIVEAWLLGDDRDRVEIALAMTESFPFHDPADMERAMASIARRWPELAPRCEELAAARTALGGA